MKILMVHNEYRYKGGEDFVVQNEFNLLKNNGIDVDLYTENNFSLVKKRMFSKGLSNIAKIIESKKYDIIHFHNLFHNLGYPFVKFCVNKNIPIIQTIHNYRYFCINGLFHDGESICNKCLSSGVKSGVIKNCYKNNYIFSGLMTLENYRIKNIIFEKVNKIIVMSEFAKKYFVNNKFPIEKIAIKPNFIFYKESKCRDLDYALILGRISKEKGIESFIQIYNKSTNRKLIIAGDGPDLNYLKNKYQTSKIQFIGRVEGEAKDKLISNSSYVVLPSVCYEMFPLTIIEAYLFKKPVLGSNLGAIPEIIKDGKTGIIFNPNENENIFNKITEMEKNYSKMGQNAFDLYNSKYSDKVNYQKLMNIYEEMY